MQVATEAWTVRHASRSLSMWLTTLAAAGASAGLTVFLARIFRLSSVGRSIRSGAAARPSRHIVALVGDRSDPGYLRVGFTLMFALGALLIAHVTSGLLPPCDLGGG